VILSYIEVFLIVSGIAAMGAGLFVVAPNWAWRSCAERDDFNVLPRSFSG